MPNTGNKHQLNTFKKIIINKTPLLTASFQKLLASDQLKVVRYPPI